ncbi:hypothetical protein Pflav_072300 [Phytohabitans flavus]|uniref:Secreted protein n=1 Tax=Phytohabitans flavus TaxID=1076124 RepID=A0A6F8Y434_9ACTN|nr:hypothetical protein [Phytohabitans flavus]BCB80820.1 hypothetical protein Pflav_072300 [Phytohabitans flavus]
MRVIALVSFGAAGVQLAALTTRSGLGAMVPMTCTSATCPPGAPLLAVKRSCTSAVRPVTGIVTEFWLPDGLKLYVAAAFSEVYAVAPWSRPRTSMFWVRAPTPSRG